MHVLFLFVETAATQCVDGLRLLCALNLIRVRFAELSKTLGLNRKRGSRSHSVFETADSSAILILWYDGCLYSLQLSLKEESCRKAPTS